MKRFTFKLQKLLDIREAKEKEVRNELAKLVNIQNIERTKQMQYRHNIIKQREYLSNNMKANKISYIDVMSFQRYTKSAERAIELAQEKIDAMEPEIQVVKDRLIEASKEKKVVDKLRERRWNEYVYEWNRFEAKENDDLNQKLYLKRLYEEQVTAE